MTEAYTVEGFVEAPDNCRGRRPLREALDGLAQSRFDAHDQRSGANHRAPLIEDLRQLTLAAGVGPTAEQLDHWVADAS